MSIEGFKLVELYKSISGPRLGIAHIPILFNAFGINLNNIRKIVFMLVRETYIHLSYPTQLHSDPLSSYTRKT